MKKTVDQAILVASSPSLGEILQNKEVIDWLGLEKELADSLADEIKKIAKKVTNTKR